jgi:hypothetical protein
VGTVVVVGVLVMVGMGVIVGVPVFVGVGVTVGVRVVVLVGPGVAVAAGTNVVPDPLQPFEVVYCNCRSTTLTLLVPGSPAAWTPNGVRFELGV